MKEDFKIVFKFPLKQLICGIKVVTDNNKPAFDWLIMNDELKEKILDLLNGKITKLDDKKHEAFYDSNSCTVFLDDTMLLRIRGWGYLTGIGGLNLGVDIANKLTNDFGYWIKNKLTSKNP